MGEFQVAMAAVLSKAAPNPSPPVIAGMRDELEARSPTSPTGCSLDPLQADSHGAATLLAAETEARAALLTVVARLSAIAWMRSRTNRQPPRPHTGSVLGVPLYPEHIESRFAEIISERGRAVLPVQLARPTATTRANCRRVVSN